MALSSTAFDWHGHESWVRLCGFEPRGEPSIALIDGVIGCRIQKASQNPDTFGRTSQWRCGVACLQANCEQFVDHCSMHNTQVKPKNTILFYFMLNTLKFKFKLGRVDRWVERKLSANSFLVQCFCCGWFDFYSKDFSTWVSLSQLLRSCHVFKFNVCLPAKWLYQTRLFNTACF